MINTIEVKCNLQTLLDVVNATGNPEIAIQMLEGTYEKPFILTEKIGKWDTKKYNTTVISSLGEEETIEMEERIPIIYQFISYDPFKDLVTYKYDDAWKRENTMSLKSWNSLEDPYALT